MLIMGCALVGVEAAVGATPSDGKGVVVMDTVIHIDRQFLISTDTFTKSTSHRNDWPELDLSTDTITQVDVQGRASIDGPEELNNRLARERAEKMKGTLLDHLPIHPANIKTSYIGEDWPLFRQLVSDDSAIPAQGELLGIIDGGGTPAEKEARIRKMNGGVTWRYLAKNILPKMRYASVAMRITRTVVPPEPEPLPKPVPVYIGPDTMSIVEEEIVVVEEELPVVAEIVPDDWYRKMYIKTNAPAWALLWQNLAVEFDLAKHWSVSLPVYWSPYNYGKQQLKFRTLAFVPEFRYWPKADNMGFYVNAHFGVASYNYAKDGEFRYQDHRGRTPALGGGVGLGYRFYFCRNHHWSMEVGVGAGIYRLDYDLYLNTPSTKNGKLVGRRQRTFYGIDQAAVTFSYSFGLRKKDTQKGGNE